MQSHNANERDVERRLSRLESPEPPADLLDRIRADIPEYLQPVDGRREPGRRSIRWQRLAAASVVLAVLGGILAYRVLQTAPEPGAVTAGFEGNLTEGVSATPLATEVGAEARLEGPAEETAVSPVGGESTQAEVEAVPGASQGPRPATERRAATTNERLAERLRVLPDLPDSGRQDRPEPAPRARQTEIGAVLPTVDEAEEQRGKKIPAGTPAPRDQVAVVGQEYDAPPAPTQSMGVSLEAPAAPGSTAPARHLREVLKPVAAAPSSTGGTAEPNDQPWGDMFFRSYGTNPFVDTEDDPRSTFGLDVDTGSYTLARGYLERGHLPPPEAIRVEEFLNYFDYGDPAPRRGEFTLTVEGAPSPWARGPRYHLLRVGVHGREISAARRLDATLTFVVDVSGSMAQENRIGLVKRALHLLVDQLGPGDRVGLVVYGSQGRVLLEPSGDLAAVRRAIDRLTPGGSTNAEEGLVLGYQVARRHFRPESINRLVLCSDGVANVGRTGPESILARVGREAEEGIELTTVGFGMGNYNDVLMEQLADQGDGNYAYVDTLDEARRIFVENLTGTLQTIASDAKIQVEFDPRVVARYRLLGYENRDVADHRFRDDSVDAGELGAGHRVTALYEIKLAEDAPRRPELAEVRLRYRSESTGRVVEDSLEVRRQDLARSWRDASPSLRLAALAAELAEILKKSYWARDSRPEELRRRAQAVERDFPGDSDVAELVRLTERATALVERSGAPPE